MSSIREKVFHGSIPCRILLNPGESRVFDASDAYYIQLPRVSYIPIYLPAIREFFADVLIDASVGVETAWLDFEGTPLKWHWPIGLLYDLLTSRDPNMLYNDALDDPGRLPWTLTIHFRADEYPSQHLMRMDKPGFMHDTFMNSVKEADNTRNGSGGGMMALSAADSKGMYEALEKLQFERFWALAGKLFNSVKYPLRHVPIKIYIPTTARVIMKLVPPKLPNGEPQTVGTALNKLAPELFPTRQLQTMARPVIHGIILPMKAPLLEVMHELIYPDGYLHIALVMMS